MLSYGRNGRKVIEKNRRKRGKQWKKEWEKERTVVNKDIIGNLYTVREERRKVGVKETKKK